MATGIPAATRPKLRLVHIDAHAHLVDAPHLGHRIAGVQERCRACAWVSYTTPAIGARITAFSRWRRAISTAVSASSKPGLGRRRSAWIHQRGALAGELLKSGARARSHPAGRLDYFLPGCGLLVGEPFQRRLFLARDVEFHSGARRLAVERGQLGSPAAALEKLQLSARLRHAGPRPRRARPWRPRREFHQRLSALDARAPLGMERFHHPERSARTATHSTGSTLPLVTRVLTSVSRVTLAKGDFGRRAPLPVEQPAQRRAAEPVPAAAASSWRHRGIVFSLCQMTCGNGR